MSNQQASTAIEYPKPWRVEYKRLYDEWDERAQPQIVDANGQLVCSMVQTVDHPGLYDETAVNTAQLIVDAVNVMYYQTGV